MPDKPPASERWARVQDLFLAALEREGDARTAFLAEACGDDAKLRGEVESLLGAHEGAGALDDLAPSETPLPDPGVDHVGAYRVLRLLGESGMGMVYLAQREGSEAAELVAVKLLRGSFYDRRLGRQLESERRLLARLEHLGIARLLDGGTTPAGQPYCVTEFVEGTPLLEYCDRERLSLRQRLSLFLDVCDPVHYAHQQLALHRDITPSNILVTREGRPRLLNLGLAKALDPTVEGGGMEIDVETRSGSWITPAYASPEQVRGGAVTTQSDVYSLGVVLYELLTGRRPYDLEGLSPADVERVVGEQLPEEPSAVVTKPFTPDDEATIVEPADPAHARRTSPRRLRKMLRGDLDAIVMKALAKEPDRRYASVSELALDVRRHLDRFPVVARQGGGAYRVSRFVSRHRLAVGAAALVLLALGLAVAAAVREVNTARAERDRVQTALAQSENLSAFLVDLFEARDPGQALVDTWAARAVLQRGIDRVDELATQPLAQAEMLDALGMVFVNLGQLERGRETLARGLAVRRQAHPEGSGAVAASLVHLAHAESALGERQRAESLYLEALAMRRRVLGPDDPAVAEALLDLAALLPSFERYDEALAHERAALELQRRVLAADDPRIAATQLRVAASLERKGDVPGAEAALRDALALQRRALGPGHPVTVRTMVSLGDLIREREASSPQAEGLYREAISLLHRSRGDDHLDLAQPMSSLATLLLARNSHAEAESLRREIVELHATRLGPNHPTVVADLDTVANLLAGQQRDAEVIQVKRRALTASRASLGDAHPSVATRLHELGRLHRVRREYAAAESLFVEAVALRRAALEADHPEVRALYRDLVDLYTAWRRPRDAARYRALLR